MKVTVFTSINAPGREGRVEVHARERIPVSLREENQG